MTIQEAVQQLQGASLTDRIQAIELLLQSLKAEIAHDEPVQVIQAPFHIRTFDLGTDVPIDRDEIYVDRVIDNGCS